MYFALLVTALWPAVLAIDNGYGITPPRGWRSWNLFHALNNDTVMRAQMKAVADTSRGVSLASLGFGWVSMDDGWQKCNCSTAGSPDASLPKCGNCKSGVGGACSWHDKDGNPVVDRRKFPNMSDLVAYGHSLGLKVGGYMNNCICMEGGDPPMGQHCTGVPHYENDVAWLVQNKFDGVKIDNCGPAHNMTKWAKLLNESGRHVRIESCHTFHPNNHTPSGWPNFPVWDPLSKEKDHTCPMNLYRTGGDISPNFASVIGEMYAMVQYSDRSDPFNHPGCWAYPDMSEIGNFNGPDPLRSDEERSHWGLWCVTSSPLILGTDLSNAAILDRIWPVVSNKEALAINDAWFGHPGTLIRSYWAAPSSGFVADYMPCDDVPQGALADDWSLNTDGHLTLTVSHNESLCLSTDLGPTGQKMMYDGCPPPTTHYPAHACGVMLRPCEGVQGRWTLTDGLLAFNTSTGGRHGALRCLAAKPSRPVGGFYGGPVSRSTVAGGCPSPRNAPNTSTFALDAGRLRVGSGACVVARPLYGAQLWAKPLGGGKVAVLVLNLLTDDIGFSLPMGDVPGLTAPDRCAGHASYAVRDVWMQKNLPSVPASTARLAMELRGHQSHFLVIGNCAV